MTREEAIRVLKYGTAKAETKYKAIDMAIKALSADPCDDAISRQAVITRIKELCNPYGKPQIDFEVGKKMIEWFKAMPSVQPVRPKGEWITWKEAGNYIPSETRFECSVCHDSAQTLCNGLDLLSPYCPNCGADMRGDENAD